MTMTTAMTWPARFPRRCRRNLASTTASATTEIEICGAL
jgi:hypothetical protein